MKRTSPPELRAMLVRELAKRMIRHRPLAPDDDGPDLGHKGWTAVGVEPMDCANTAGVRPCPFLGCPHHLLLDYVPTKRREPSLTLSRARTPDAASKRLVGVAVVAMMWGLGVLVAWLDGPAHARMVARRARERLPRLDLLGRREELPPEAPRHAVAQFTRRALEVLWEMPDTCSREVAMRGGLTVRDTAAILGAEEDEVGKDEDDALCALRGRAIVNGADPDDEDEMRTAVLEGLGMRRRVEDDEGELRRRREVERDEIERCRKKPTPCKR